MQINEISWVTLVSNVLLMCLLLKGVVLSILRLTHIYLGSLLSKSWDTTNKLLLQIWVHWHLVNVCVCELLRIGRISWLCPSGVGSLLLGVLSRLLGSRKLLLIWLLLHIGMGVESLGLMMSVAGVCLLALELNIH